jgi:hypothetical protein
LAGAAKDTSACPFPGVADTDVGASGTVAGVAEEEAEDATESPTLFVATTVKVYGVPLVRPVIVIGEEDPVAVKPPGLDVTV